MGTIIVFEAGLQDHREYWLQEISKRNELILLQPWEPTWELPYIKSFEKCTFDQWDKELIRLKKLFSKYKIDGVICLNEGTVNYANDLQRALNLPCTHQHLTPKALRNKKVMREELQRSGLRSPQTFQNIKDIKYPVIVKPTEFMASLGVSLVHSKEELNEAINLASKIDIPEENLRDHYDLSSEVVIEEYIAGEEFSIECMVQDGQMLDLRLTKKMKVAPPLFYETGHISNAVISEEIDLKIKHYTQDVVAAFNLLNGLFHFEVMIKDNEIYTIELAARPGGDLIPFLYKISEDINYPQRVECTISGKKIAPLNTSAKESAAVFFPFGQSLTKEFLEEETGKYDCQIISAKWQEKVRSSDLSERLGEIILSGHYDNLVKLLAEFNQKCSHVV